MKQFFRRYGAAAAIACSLALGVLGTAAAQQPVPGPRDDSVGVEGRITSPPPTQPATIVSPANGQVFTTVPITVAGSCPNGTIVKVFSNNIFVGSAQCNNGTYNLQISLFAGRNDLVARVFDALDQEGPASPTITVTFNDPQFGQFGNQVLLTSQFARRAADPGTLLTWPVALSGGVGPYALSADWGDGTPVELKSLEFGGIVNLTHTYREAGIYRVIFKVTDRNGSSSFLQVIAVANGSGGTNRTVDDSSGETIITEKSVLWEPAAALMLLLPLTFWLGRKYEINAIRRRLDREYHT